MTENQRDKYTFQFSDLRHGKAAALAMAKVTMDFIHYYHESPHYEQLLCAFIERLLEGDDAVNEESLKVLEASLIAQQADILKRERESDKDRKKWVPSAPVRNKIEEESSEEEEEYTSEERRRREQAEEERLKKQEEEWQRANERFEALQRERMENEARLRERARKVDFSAFEQQLKQQGAVLVNPGANRQKKGGGGGKQDQQMSEEEVGKLLQEVAEVMKEKERLNTVLHTSDEELPAALTAAKAELAEMEAKAKALGDAPVKVPSLNKGQITQTQQKLSKQNIEKNRYALQLKAMEPNPIRTELLEVMQKRDLAAIRVERAESS